MTAACACGGVAQAAAPEAAPAAGEILLHLPKIHCAVCIANAERALRAVPGVSAARVNLTLKRAAVTAAPSVTAAALAETLRAAGIEAQELDPSLLTETTDRTGRDLLVRLGVAGFAMMNVMLLSVAVWSGAAEATERLFHLLSALITLPAIAFAGRPFFEGAVAGLRAGRPGMDLPIALAILLATALSLRETFWGGTGHAWFEAGLSLTFFLLAGRYLDHRGRQTARSAAEALAALDVPRALVVRADGTTATVASAKLRTGDLVRVLPGMRAPADGTVTEGASDLDRSAMTGESAPEAVGPGAEVQAGETVLTGALTLRVLRAGQDTTLARMTALVAEAEAARGRYLSLADRAAQAYVPIVHLLAFGAFAYWAFAADNAWIAAGIAVSVLIITCPCALGLAVPAVSVAATGRLFRAGLLVKNRTTLERLAEVDTVVFDKTGTLTTGTPEITAAPDGPALSVALGLAEGSTHPLSRAIAAHARARGAEPAPVTDIEEVPGIGLRGRLAGREVRLGRKADGGGTDATCVELDLGQGRSHDILFRETLRPAAAETVAALKAQGLRVLMLSGDAPGPVARIAADLGIDEARPGLKPADKALVLETLASQGAKVLMVGDGLNDTAALAAAHAAISPGTALDAPRAAADMVLLSEGLAPVATAVATARAARRRMRENLWIAVLYNLVAIPVALVGLATPFLAALAMSASSITVSLNAARVAR
ncbi:cadmium-translocating P-type ATPase [Rhodobacterales bacterium HKCCE2091]|nr:cadmium-translocating P-type ATPase [Rhodobacterales bacterium HKCCE2091]